MKNDTQTGKLTRWLLQAFLLALSCFAIGCGSIKFMPARYVPETEGHVRINGAKTVVLCAPYDCVPNAERYAYDPRFDPSRYVEAMFQAELQASGVPFEPAQFDAGGRFEDLARVLLHGTEVPENSVVLACAIISFPDVSTLVCDVKVFTTRGALLFEKRGICVSLKSWWNPKDRTSVPFDASLADNSPDRARERDSYLRASRSVMRQIFCDPDFQKALQ